jgi:hypothetical protein
MDKKTIYYIGLVLGIVFILIGGGLLYLKEKKTKNIKTPTNLTQQKGRKVEVIISTNTEKTSPRISNLNKPIITTNSNQQKRKIAFKYRSSKVKTVYLIGDFNKWNKIANPLKLGDNFTFETILLLSPGEYKYCFLADGKRVADPNNRKTVHLKTSKVSVLTVKPIQ